MQISLCFYICCVLLFQYSIAVPPWGLNEPLKINLNFQRTTLSGGVIYPQQPGYLSHASPDSQHPIPPSRPAGPDSPPSFNFIPDPQHHATADSPHQAGPSSQPQSSQHHPRALNQHEQPPWPQQQEQAAHSHSPPNQHGNRQNLHPHLAARTKRRRSCRFCEFEYRHGEYEEHMAAEGHITTLDLNRDRRTSISPVSRQLWMK